MKYLLWGTCLRPGYTIEVTHIGHLKATLVCGGAAILGRNIWVGTLDGEVVVIAEIRDRAESAIRAEAKRLLVEAVTVLEST